MENLDSDLTLEILKNLSGKDILSTCKTSEKLNKICTGERYQKLWKEKLLEEYEVLYEKGDLTPYEKYLETMKLYERSFYKLTLEIPDDDHYNYTYFFNNKENAISYAIYLILSERDEKDEIKEGNFYTNIKNILDSNSYYESEYHNTYEIEKIKLNISPQKFFGNLNQRIFRGKSTLFPPQ